MNWHMFFYSSRTSTVTTTTAETTTKLQNAITTMLMALQDFVMFHKMRLMHYSDIHVLVNLTG